jgi:hypothetical protein
MGAPFAVRYSYGTAATRCPSRTISRSGRNRSFCGPTATEKAPTFVSTFGNGTSAQVTGVRRIRVVAPAFLFASFVATA